MTIKKFRELRKRQKEVRRQTIVEVAEEILKSKGIDAVTIRSVAKAAGVSVGSIYMYFKNKEELFLSMLLEHLDALDLAFEKTVEGSDPVEVLKALASDYRSYYLNCGKHINAIGYLYQQRSQAGEINPELMAELEQVLAQILSRVQGVLERPDFEPFLKGLDPARAIPVIWGFITGVAELTLTSARSSHAGFDFEQVLDDTIHILIKT